MEPEWVRHFTGMGQVSYRWRVDIRFLFVWSGGRPDPVSARPGCGVDRASVRGWKDSGIAWGLSLAGLEAAFVRFFFDTAYVFGGFGSEF